MLRDLLLELSFVAMRCSSNIDEVVVLQETGRHSLEPLQRRQRRIQKQCYQIPLNLIPALMAVSIVSYHLLITPLSTI